MRVGVIGQGYMGRTHAQAWSVLAGDDAVRYVVSPGTRLLFEPVPDAVFTNDLRQVLEDPEVDAVSICTPTHSHADIAIRSLRAGKHVLLEKPIALSIADAHRICAAAQTTQRVLMVAQVVRFFSGYVRLREVVGPDSIGEVLAVRAARVLNTPDWADWWFDESQSGGVTVDFAIHDYDQTNLFLGEPVHVQAVQARTGGPIEASIQYAGGGIGQVLSYPGTPVGVPFQSSIELLGTSGVASYRLVAASPTDPDDPARESTLRMQTGTQSLFEHVPDNEPYLREVEYFMKCVRTGAQPVASPTESAIMALRVSLAARESLRREEPVPVSEVL